MGVVLIMTSSEVFSREACAVVDGGCWVQDGHIASSRMYLKLNLSPLNEIFFSESRLCSVIVGRPIIRSYGMFGSTYASIVIVSIVFVCSLRYAKLNATVLSTNVHSCIEHTSIQLFPVTRFIVVP
jgi:hypothetical protein